MTPIGLKLLTARVDRLEKIIRALRGLDDCRYEIDAALAEADLKQLLEAIPYETQTAIHDPAPTDNRSHDPGRRIP